MSTESSATKSPDPFDEDEAHTLLAMVAVDEASNHNANQLDTLLAMVATAEASNGNANQLSAENVPREERERARSRAKTKRSYHRRAVRSASLNMLRDLREEVAELEGKVQELTSSYQAALDLVDSPHTATPPDQESLERQVRNLALARARMDKENAALRALFRQLSYKLQHIRDLVFAVDDKLFVANRSSFALLRPLTLADCLEVRQRALDEFRTFTANEHYVKPQYCLYGWQTRRIVEHDATKFAMTKTVYHHTAESIFQRTWKILSEPAGIAMYYSNALDFKCNVVQKIDQNNVAWYLESRLHSAGDPTGGNHVILKAVVLMSRFLTRNGLFILVRGLGSDHFEIFDTPTEGVMEVWTDVLSCMQFNSTGPNGEHCQTFYAGIYANGGADPKFRLAEIAHHVLRWEAVALGARFTLPSADS